MIVSKFGGTSVKDFASMQHSAEIIAADSNRRFIVISATAGTTDDLLSLTNNVSEDYKKQLLERIEDRHFSIINQLNYKEDATKRVNKLLAELSQKLKKIGRDKLWKDAIMAYGELLSTSIFAEVLRENDIDVELLDARSIIITDSNFGLAEPDISQIKTRASKFLKPEVIYLTQGFIGSDIFGNTTTLGRGGSDLSASLFAEAINAETLEVWTDVAGVYTTDPRLVENAKPINQISLDEAAELSVFGGKILHHSTLKPAIRSGVKVKILSSKDPGLEGTTVVPKAENQPVIRAITMRESQSLLTIKSQSMRHQHGFLMRVAGVLDKYKISVDLVTTSEVTISLILDTAGQPSIKTKLKTKVLDELREFCEVEFEDGYSLVAIIGNKLNATKGVSGKLFYQLADYNIRVICHGSSPNNICFLVAEQEARKIVKKLHKYFIEDV